MDHSNEGILLVAESKYRGPDQWQLRKIEALSAFLTNDPSQRLFRALIAFAEVYLRKLE